MAERPATRHKVSSLKEAAGGVMGAAGAGPAGSWAAAAAASGRCGPTRSSLLWGVGTLLDL